MVLRLGTFFEGTLQGTGLEQAIDLLVGHSQPACADVARVFAQTRRLGDMHVGHAGSAKRGTLERDRTEVALEDLAGIAARQQLGLSADALM